MTPLARQLAAIVLVLGAALALAVTALARAGTSPQVKVILAGLLVGLVVGAILAARRGDRS